MGVSDLGKKVACLYLGMGCFASGVWAVTTPEVNEKLGQAIRENNQMKVLYKDVLGEGAGGWDADPLYPDKTTNCILWLDTLVAEVYGSTPGERTQIMNRLRYYGGKIGFGMRKHFSDQWINFEPGPFVPVIPPRCEDRMKSKWIELDPSIFLDQVGYSCPLYRMKETRQQVHFLETDDFVNCASDLEPGFYVIMGMASPKYLKRYGSTSGPMGYVHSFVLEIRDSKKQILHNASILSGKVKHTRFAKFVRRSKSWYEGFVAFRLDPQWDWRSPVSVEQDFQSEVEEVLRCEAALVKAGKRRDPERDFRITK